MFGILNLNKPTGWTSHGAVNRVKRLVQPAGAGHAGTLDPLANGVLIICIGPATRLADYVQLMPKEYEATFLLGSRSPSDDLETAVETCAAAVQPTREQIEGALPRFTGVIEQRPPAYSAVRVGGQRAYKLVRRGGTAEPLARPIEIYRLEIAHFAYPELALTIRCSSGTYVRSLGRDVAESLGTCAVMSRLVRTAVGDFRLEDALDGRCLDADALQQHLLSPLTALTELPRFVVTSAQAAVLRLGGRLSLDEVESALDPWPTRVAAVDEQSRLVAILKLARSGLLKPSPNFPQPE